MITCDSCAIALGSERVRVLDGVYCCVGCAAGGPCVCTYEHDLGRYPPSPYAKPVSMSDLFDRYERGAENWRRRSCPDTRGESNEERT